MLSRAARCFIFKVDGGGIYPLTVRGASDKLLDQRVTVEDTRSGFDCLDLD